MAAPAHAPPIIVLYGDEEHQKETALAQALDKLLPPQVDRALALSTHDAGQKSDSGTLTVSSVIQDLATLPFLADRRVVVIRNADTFITASREQLEKYLTAPARTGVLVLECRSFPKTTRLHRAAAAAGGQIQEFKKLSGRAAIDFAIAEAKAQDKRLDHALAARLVDLVGQESGVLAGEIEKLCLYTGKRNTISPQDLTDLVGQSREEKIFAVADAAATGRLSDALRLWQQVLETDSAAAFRAVGGFAFVVRRWLAAHQMLAEGANIRAIAPKLMMWGREKELEMLLHRLRPRTLRRLLAAIADLDSQAKSGTRSIERGIELLLVRLAAPAA